MAWFTKHHEPVTTAYSRALTSRDAFSVYWLLPGNLNANNWESNLFHCSHVTSRRQSRCKLSSPLQHCLSGYAQGGALHVRHVGPPSDSPHKGKHDWYLHGYLPSWIGDFLVQSKFNTWDRPWFSILPASTLSLHFLLFIFARRALN